jgi:hypothetical protein
MAMCLARRVCRSGRVPWYMTTGHDGSHLWNSLIQLGRVASGATMRYGPGVSQARRCATSPITWIVLPRPCGGGQTHRDGWVDGVHTAIDR